MSRHSRIEREESSVGDSAHRPRRPRSLVVQVARKMVLWACINTLILTTLGYVLVSDRVERSTLSYLSGYLTQRLRSETQVFRTGEANLVKVEEQFLAQYRDPDVLKNPKFDEYFRAKEDGSLRLRDRFFEGTIDHTGLFRSGVTGFVANRQPEPSRDLQRRLVLGYQIVSDLGPAWKGQFANLYLAAPENAGVVYWPEVPWGREVPVTRPNVQVDKPWWSSLYFDAVAKKWNVTYLRPFSDNGRAIMTAGHDILLDDLMMRLVHDHPAGAYNMVLKKDGDLIAHPERFKDLKVSGSQLNVESLGDRELQSIYRGIINNVKQHRSSDGVHIFENKEIGAYVCYGEISGPGWWFVTVYPRERVLASAREAANGLLLLGIGSFTIMTLIVIWVLRERVARPISQMRVASESVSQGDYQAIADGSVTLPEAENNEIGMFATSFKGMAMKVGDSHRQLEETVLTRTMELEVANRELQDLSFRDGLTRAYNRRSFDRDLEQALDRKFGRPEKSLLLCDIDFFKLYNDTYGHPAGDQVLCSVLSEMMRVASPSRVYRYGGEEVAIIFEGRSEGERRALAEKAIGAVAALAIPHKKSPHTVVTVSGGFATISESIQSGAELLAVADALLYRAKSLGRNRLVDGTVEDDCNPA